MKIVRYTSAAFGVLVIGCCALLLNVRRFHDQLERGGYLF